MLKLLVDLFVIVSPLALVLGCMYAVYKATDLWLNAKMDKYTKINRDYEQE